MTRIGETQALTLTTAIERQRPTLKAMLPASLASQADRLFEFALAAARNPAIAQCSQSSIIESLYTSAKMGLMPDGIEGAVVPRGGEAKFEPMYQGLVKAYLRSGNVSQVWADVIMEGEEYEVTGGSSPDIKHTPDIRIDRQDWGKLLAAYAVARFPDGNKVTWICTKHELERLRAKGAKNGPWSTHPVPMALKTPLKRLRKLVPLEPSVQAALQDLEKQEEGVMDISAEVRPVSSVAELVGVSAQASPAAVPASDTRYCFGVPITIAEPFETWKAQLTGATDPKLATISWAQVADAVPGDELEPIVDKIIASFAGKPKVSVNGQKLAIAWEERRLRLMREEVNSAAETAF